MSSEQANAQAVPSSATAPALDNSSLQQNTPQQEDQGAGPQAQSQPADANPTAPAALESQVNTEQNTNTGVATQEQPATQDPSQAATDSAAAATQPTADSAQAGDATTSASIQPPTGVDGQPISAAPDTSLFENAQDESFGTAVGGNEDEQQQQQQQQSQQQQSSQQPQQQQPNGQAAERDELTQFKLADGITDSELNAFREQDRFLPIANVGRIMKRCLPLPTKVSKEAKECVQECTSEFISFITSEASERCAMEKRKTLNGEDILYAMINLGFENYAEVLKIYLSKYRGLQRVAGKRSAKKRPRLDGDASVGYDEADETYDQTIDEEEADDEERHAQPPQPSY